MGGRIMGGFHRLRRFGAAPFVFKKIRPHPDGGALEIAIHIRQGWCLGFFTFFTGAWVIVYEGRVADEAIEGDTLDLTMLDEPTQ